MPWVQIYFVDCEYMYFLNILHHLQTANRTQLWPRKQIQIMIY